MTAQFSEVLVWVLVHSLWQGILIAAVVSMVLHWLPARRAETRYAASLTGLLIVVLCGMVTWSVLTLEPQQGDVSHPIVAGQPRADTAPVSTPALIPAARELQAGQTQSVTDTPALAPPRTSSFRDWMPWLAVLWLIGVSVMLARMIAAIVQVRRWRSPAGAVSSMHLESLVALKDELCARLRLKWNVSLSVSQHVDIPAVVGTLWPCILIPPALLTGMPLDQWRVILAHELAHIRRYDVLVNLVQMLIESLLFFNPAVWWLSRQIRIEREACCDALAAKVCGQPLSVARTLVEFAASLNGDARWPAANKPAAVETGATHSEALVAFADPQQQGDLTDRVQRLVQPDTAAMPRVSWLSLGVVLTCLALTWVALQWGTSLAVQTAARLMSPRERVEKLERLQSEAAGVFLPPEAPASKPKASDTPPATETPKEKIPVTLVVRTEAGEPVPKNLQLQSVTRSGNSSGVSTLGAVNSETNEHRQELSFQPCRLRIGASAPGYAPVVSPIVTLLPGSKGHTVELTLRMGKTAKVLVTDQKDQPIPAAIVYASTPIEMGGSSGGFSAAQYIADAAGIATLNHVGDMPYVMRLQSPGFQRHETKVEFKLQDSVTVNMKRALAVNVHVQDSATGNPIANARIVVASWSRGNSSHSFGDPRQLSSDKWNNFGETDQSGDIVLNELQDGLRYTLAVLGKDYGMAILPDVYAGQAATVVKLSPPIKLAGRLEGDLSRLTRAHNGPGGERPIVPYAHSFNAAFTRGENANVEPDGSFEINDLAMNQKVTLNLPDRRVDYVMTKSITDVVLKIDSAIEVAEKVPTRQVIIRLTGTSLQAPARGQLSVYWQHFNAAANKSVSEKYTIRANEVRLEVPVGASLSFSPENLVGYRIDEQRDIKINAGNAPQIVDVTTRPAGGIYGKIVRPDGQPATSGFITVFATQLPPGETSHQRINPSFASASADFLATLPLGGRYRVLARETNEIHNLWTVSDEITLDESHPIAEVRLQLPAGRTIPVQVLSPDGTPIANQPVLFSLGFSQPKGHSFSTSVNRITDLQGKTFLEEASVDQPVSPLESSISVEVVGDKYIGWRGPLSLSGTNVIRLETGVSATGIVIEAASGKPIPRAEIRIYPQDFNVAKFKGFKNATTDEAGKFRFDGLEAMEYSAHVEGTVPKGTVITRNPDGSTSYKYPDGFRQLSIEGGASTTKRWEVQIPEGSRLTVPQ